MADEKKTNATETTTKKSSKLGTIITIIISIIIGAGAMFGVDVTWLQKTAGGEFTDQFITLLTETTVKKTIAYEGFVNVVISDEKVAELVTKITAENIAEKADTYTKACELTIAAEKAKLEAAKEKVEEKIEGTDAAPAADAAATVTANTAGAAPAVEQK